MVIVIAGLFEKEGKNGIKTGHKKYVASHGYDLDSGNLVVLPPEHPTKLGAVKHPELDWVIY